MDPMTQSGDLIRDHIRHMTAQGRRPRTIDARRNCLLRMEESAGVALSEVTRDDVEDYIEAQRAPATKRVYLAHLRAFYKWAVDDERLQRDPTRRVVAPVVKRGVPRPISEEDLARALATAPDLERAWMTLAAFAGLRACEIALVCAEHVVRTDPPYLLLPETKGGGSATVALADVVLEELSRWPSTGPLWRPDGPVHYQVVSRKVNAHLRSLGIRAGLHSLRHRFGTQTYRATGHDLRQTQELLRHASPATTAIYTQLDPRGAHEAVNGLPVPRWEPPDAA